MSGSFISSGVITYKKEDPPEIYRLNNLKIESISIQVLPLTTSEIINGLRYIGKLLQPFVHPIFTPTICHVAIQLNMENNEDIIIMEYGQYYPKDYDPNQGILSVINSVRFESMASLDSINHPFREDAKNTFWYINKDGVRLSKVNNDYFNDKDPNKEKIISDKVKKIIASHHYGLSIEELDKRRLLDILEFYNVDCDIKNKITLGELCEYFKGEEWEASNYNFSSQNCQKFAAKVIKILKAVRKYEKDKIRMFEKMVLPNCVIGALWDNEELSFSNTMGRIPIVGIIHDLIRL